MKILMVNKFLAENGGSERYMIDLGQALCAMGHTVEYFGMDQPDKAAGNSFGIYTKNVDYHTDSRKEKIAAAFSTIYSSEAKKKMLAILERFEPDAVHLNNFNYQLTPSVIEAVSSWRKANHRKCRLVYTAHDYQLLCPNHMMLKNHTCCDACVRGSYFNCISGKCIHNSAMRSALGAAEAFYWHHKKTYQEIDTIICCSDFMKTMFERNEKLSRNAIALHNFTDRIVPADLPKKQQVLYFGRFSEEKGMKTLLSVCKACPDVHFVFAGTGPMEEEINQLPNAENRGFLGKDALFTLIGESAFSVYPSEWYENCPYSVMESIQLGTPVIASRIGGIPELIEDGVSGLLFESGDAGELCECVNRLIQDREYLCRLQENCRKVSFPSAEEYIKDLLQIYRGTYHG